MPVSRRTLEEQIKFAAMRDISEWVDEQRHQQAMHTPPWGTVGVGGADFDFLLKATVGEAYLRILRRGGTPEQARAEAVQEGNYCVQKWNNYTHKTRACINSTHELKRWDGSSENEADCLHRRFLILMEYRRAHSPAP